jgi:hypothetical protein
MRAKLLLVCGIVSSVLYVAMTVFIGMQWKDYSSASHTISELSAIDAPTRSLWVVAGAFYTLLVSAFGWGVWMSAAGRRALRTAGALILVYGSLGLLWPFAPMHQREVLAAGGGTLSDTMHLVLASVTVLLMLLAIACAAAALGTRFRVYSITSLVVLVAFGALTFLDAPRLSANLPTPWIGVWERINVGAFLLWIVVLAATLLKGGEGRTSSAPVSRRASVGLTRGHLVLARRPPCSLCRKEARSQTAGRTREACIPRLRPVARNGPEASPARSGRRRAPPAVAPSASRRPGTA